ncbi:phosphatase inhibitor [Trichoderma arundinaceum]|uniref:Type 1 phosphatases regulator n=1 Tax=Trichoderma arundinaceum TaxID=490622 RepID=A0A395NY14_TRIAR|nr:phosphatase inhibitor [Trichoderma arundinaceum]
MSQQQERDAPAPTASQTTTHTTRPETAESAPRVLRLRGGNTSNGRSVQWAEDVVDNEGLGRKSSKVCCIYHRPKGVDESSDESSSDSSSSDSDSDSEHDSKRKVGGGKDDCGHSHGPGHRHSHGRGRRANGKKKRAPSPNAYEKVPKPKPREVDQEVSK